MEKTSVAVVGAGLAGLCLAQRLVRAGIDVQVYERDAGPFVRRQGYRITIDRDGLGALRDSLPTELYELVLATAGAPGGYFRLTNSRLRDAVKLTFKPTPDGERQIDRQVLRSILLVGLADRVHYGKAVTAVEPAGADGLVLRFADNSAVRASTVVGADGIGSAVRAQIMPGAEPENTGFAGIYGRTPLVQGGRSVLPDALGRSGVLAIGDEPARAFFFTSIQFQEAPEKAFERLAPGHSVPAVDDYVMWGLVVKQDEIPSEDIRNDPRALRSFAARSVSAFHPLVTELINTAEVETTMLSTFSVGRRPTDWRFARATMMGDAVHAMPPVGAHGGNTALRDAALLGRKLVEAHESGGSVEAAISAYQAEMLPYAFKSVDAAAGMTRRLTGNGFSKWVLTRVLPRLHRVTVPATPTRVSR